MRWRREPPVWQTGPSGAGEIVHDAEYYVLKQQNAKQWAEEDKALDERLAAFRQKNGGKPPNIF